MAKYDVYAVQADLETGLWLSEPEATGETVDMAEWHARVDIDGEHYDVFDRSPGDPLFGPAPETCAVIVRWVA